MDARYELKELIGRRRGLREPWLEFLRVPALSMGLYVLATGSEDLQEPHTEDEVYYIVSGLGSLRIGDEDHVARAGTLLFVPARAPHRFHGITEELTALVFFAPAEGSAASTAS